MPGLPVRRRLPMCGMCRRLWRGLRRWCCRMRRIMRGLLRIMGPLPLVLGSGAFRMASPQDDISLAGSGKRVRPIALFRAATGSAC